MVFFKHEAFRKKSVFFLRAIWFACISFIFQFKLFKTSLGSLWSSLLRTGFARLTEPGPRALTVQTIPRAPTVRDYSMGEIQEV